MLRQEELMKQPVYLQQAVAFQPQTLFIERQKALTLQLAQGTGKSLLKMTFL